MTCEAYLDLMLEADPGVLAGTGPSPLASHVRECAKCGAVAQRILADSSAIAPGIVSRHGSRGVAVALALAAGVALFMVASRRLETPMPTVRAAHPAPAAAVPKPVPTVASVRQPRIHRAEVKPFQPVAYRAQPFVPSPAVAEPPVVSVRAEPGQRVAVIHTADPKVTIVWLY